MPRTRTWEEECLPRLKVLRNGPVALCVLWNLIEKLPEYAPGIEDVDALGVIGNLRTPIGIGWFLRGLWQFSEITRIVLWGSDLTGSGEALIRLWRSGPTADHTIPDFDWKIDQLIPLDAIDELRRSVELIDLRKEKRATAVFPSLDSSGGSVRKVRSFPPTVIPDRIVLPNEPSSIFIRAADPGDAWQRILQKILLYGKPRDTRKKESIVHCFNIHAVFPVPVADESSTWFGISTADAERYLADVLRPSPPMVETATGREVATVDYHYGQRIQDWLGHNQLEEVILRLKENSETKRASISVLQAGDLEELEDAPCWSLITFAVINGALHASNIFRSHDMFGGWPNNVLAVLHLHRKISESLGLDLGSVEVISQNAQVYSRHLAAAEEWLQKKKFTFEEASHQIGFREDPAGVFVFSIVPAEEEQTRRIVRAQLMNQRGDEVLWEQENPNPSVLIRSIVEFMVLDPQHIRYLGCEEEKLNRSLKANEPYHQG